MTAHKRRSSFSLLTLFVVVTVAAILTTSGLAAFRWAFRPRFQNCIVVHDHPPIPSDHGPEN
jgi:Tfp pilus assembly protein FimT